MYYIPIWNVSHTCLICTYVSKVYSKEIILYKSETQTNGMKECTKERINNTEKASMFEISRIWIIY